jgi:hypothetical protein
MKRFGLFVLVVVFALSTMSMAGCAHKKSTHQKKSAANVAAPAKVEKQPAKQAAEPKK